MSARELLAKHRETFAAMVRAGVWVQDAKQHIAEIDAELAGPKVVWEPHPGARSMQRAFVGDLRLEAWADGLWSVERVTHREQFRGDEVANGMADTEDLAKLAAESAAGVTR